MSNIAIRHGENWRTLAFVANGVAQIYHNSLYDTDPENFSYY